MSERAADRPHVVVLGLMGVGKTTIGRAVAEDLGRPHRDSDQDIENLTGVSGKEYADQFGVPALHELEGAVLIGALARPEASVISAAASTVERSSVRRLLPRRAVVIRLVADLETLQKRQAAGGHRRPMEMSELIEIAERRDPMFAAVEDLRVSADGEVEVTVQAVMNYLGQGA